nr:acyl-homoserine-lactone synthase [Ensifer sp. LC163]
MSLGFERFVTKSRLHFCDLNRRWICRTPQRRNEEEAGVISITALPGSASDRSDAYLDQMFRLRARVFSERLGWDVTIRDGRERDTFDDLRPAYIIALNGTGRVVACVRLPPASRPMMVTTVFSENLGDNVLTRKHQMVESSRFCVDTAVCERGEGGTPRNHPGHVCRHHGVVPGQWLHRDRRGNRRRRRTNSRQGRVFPHTYASVADVTPDALLPI